MKQSFLGTTISITKAIRRKLRAEIKRTGMTALMLLKDAPDIPEGLTVAHANRWIGGLIDTAPARHFDYVMAKWATLPDNAGRVATDGTSLPKRGARHRDGARRIEVTDEMSKLLRAELARTGIDHAHLLDGIDDKPEGLNARILRGWLYRDAATTSEAYWDFVIARLQAAPGLRGPLPLKEKRS